MSTARPYIAIDPADQELLVAELGAARAGSALLVWFRLNREALRAGGNTAAVSLTRIAYDTGLSRRRVNEQVLALERLGFITVTRQTSETAAGNHQHDTNMFALLRGNYATETGLTPRDKMSLPGDKTPLPRDIFSPLQGCENVPTITRNTRKNNKSASAPVVFPASLDVPEFRAAWADWERYHREKRKPLTPSTQKLHLKSVAAFSVADAIAKIEASIAGGWMKLVYPPKLDTTTPTPTAPKEQRLCL